MGPHPTARGVFNFYSPGAGWPGPADWFRRQPPNADLERLAQARIAAWEKRREAAERGDPMLTVAELDELIAKTIARMGTAGPQDAAALSLQVENMRRELRARTWLGEDVTNWPAPVAEDERGLGCDV